MPATLEAPIGSEIMGADTPLSPETIAEIDAAFAPEPTESTTPAPETPAVEPPAETPSETPAPETAPEPSETRSSATAPTPANETASRPTAWVPGDDERQLANSLGWHEAVVRGFRSAEDFYRAAATQQAHQRQQANAASQAQKPAEPDPFQAILDDPLAEDSTKSIARIAQQQAQRLAQLEQAVGQQGQGFQQHQQALQQAEAQRQLQQFHAAVDEHFGDVFGKVSDADPGKQSKRQELMQAFSQLAQIGRVKDFSRSEIAKAFALAFPDESQQLTLRSLKQTARRQADGNLGTASRSTSRAADAGSLDPSSDPGMAQIAKDYGIPLD